MCEKKKKYSLKIFKDMKNIYEIQYYRDSSSLRHQKPTTGVETGTDWEEYLQSVQNCFFGKK